MFEKSVVFLPETGLTDWGLPSLSCRSRFIPTYLYIQRANPLVLVVAASLLPLLKIIVGSCCLPQISINEVRQEGRKKVGEGEAFVPIRIHSSHNCVDIGVWDA